MHVIFDFRGTELIEDPNNLRNHLYCLLPNQNKFDSILIKISRESFISNAINGELIKTQQEQTSQIVKPPIKDKFINRSEPTHYYDPRKGRLFKKTRF